MIQFASRAKIIKNRPVQNKTSDDALLSRYLRMIEDLKAQLKVFFKNLYHHIEDFVLPSLIKLAALAVKFRPGIRCGINASGPL